MFDWVGGRTSEMSAVGLLPAALQVSGCKHLNPWLPHLLGCPYKWNLQQGIDIREMLAGAALMDNATRSTEVRKIP